MYVSIILETLQGVVGDDVTPNIKSTETAGVYLLPDLKFESEGKVQLWEVLAIKPGVIRLLVSINCDFVRMETLENISFSLAHWGFSSSHFRHCRDETFMVPSRIRLCTNPRQLDCSSTLAFQGSKQLPVMNFIAQGINKNVFSRMTCSQ